MSIIVGGDSCKRSNKTKVSYLHCRLCAFLKSRRGLVNLHVNEQRRKTVVAQLSRLNISGTNLDSEHDTLPKRICICCINALDWAYNFALNVQKAQEVLNIHILAQQLKKDDHNQSLSESSDLPSIVESNGGVLVLSPSSIQAIVERSTKSTSNNNSPTSKNNSDVFLDKNINEDILDRSENDYNISQSFQTTEGSNINDLENDSKFSTDEIDLQITSEVNEFEEEYKITVTDYQITKSKPDTPTDHSNYGEHRTDLSFLATEAYNINGLQINTSDKTIERKKAGDESDLFKEEVKGEEISGICFDFEEENIDENSEIVDNNFEILRAKTNLACNANEVENSDKVLMYFEEEIEVDTELMIDTLPTARIDSNLCGSSIENSVEIATKTDSDINIKETKLNRCVKHEIHTDEVMIKQEETSSDDEPQNEQLECVKQNVFKDLIRKIPVVVLNRISDADIVALYPNTSTALDNNVKHGTGLSFKSNKSRGIHEISCDKNETESNDDLIISECISWKQYRWKCASCEETFPHIDKLIAHSKDLHGYCNLYQCTDCNSQARFLENFIKHLQGHREQLKHSCFKCFKEYANPHSVHLHYKMHAKSKLKCLGCHETFSNKENLEKHYKKYKNKNVERNYSEKKYADGLTCNICQKVCTNLHTLLQHLEKYHSVQRKHYTCHKCGEIYYKLRSLMSHIKYTHIVHYTSCCKLCIESFENAHDLRNHVYKVHGKKPFTCDDCGTKFKSLTTLQKHFLSHKGI